MTRILIGMVFFAICTFVLLKGCNNASAQSPKSSTLIKVELMESLDSGSADVGKKFTCKVIVISDRYKDAKIRGIVSHVKAAGKIKGRGAEMGLIFNEIIYRDGSSEKMSSSQIDEVITKEGVIFPNLKVDQDGEFMKTPRSIPKNIGGFLKGLFFGIRGKDIKLPVGTRLYINIDLPD